MCEVSRALIADDQEDVVEALRMLLRRENIQTEAADSPAAVLDKLKAGSYDLLLMDLNYARDTTSGKEGLDLLANVQAIDGTLPVVAMTAWATVDLAVEAMRRGVNDFILKPWDNTRLVRILRQQIEKGRGTRRELRRAGEEWEEARAAGQALLPKRIPQIPGFAVEASSQAAGLLNGDYFDVMELDRGNLGIAVADASGKGTPAALLMSNIQATVRALAGQAPWDLCGTLNRSVHRNAARAKFATFFYGALDATGMLTYANAGHCAPVLLRSNGEIERLYPTGTVLGLFPDAHYEPAAIKLATGDRLLLYSDGITEAENENDEQFGEERLCGIARSVRRGTAAEIRDRVFEAVGAFRKGPARDDATLVAIAAM